MGMATRSRFYILLIKYSHLNYVHRKAFYMTPIIQPYLFYLADMASRVRFIFNVVGLLAFGLGVLFLISWLDEDVEFRHPEWILPIMRICLTLTILSIIIMLFVPTTETVYKMIIAQNVTNDNLAKALEIIKQSIDYLVDVIR